MKNILFFLTSLFLILFVVSGYSQDFEFQYYDFSDKNLTVPQQYEKETEVILEQNTKIEFGSNNNSSYQYYLFHEKIYINSDNAVQRNNRVYIPSRLDESLVMNKVRIIKKNGEIINFDSKDIKEEIDEERGLKYNYYAINGLDKGAILEKIFILKENPQLRGVTIKMQSEYPIVNTSFELIYPQYLGFKYKSYNGLPEAQLNEEAYDGKYSLLIADSNVNGLSDEERYSNRNKHIKKFRYKLNSNSYNGTNNLFSYSDFARNVYENLHPEIDKKNQKLIDDFIKNIVKSSNQEEQIWNIENKVKTTIVHNKYFNSNKDLADVLKNKQANDVELLRLYIAIFEKLNVPFEVVLTSKRYAKHFDKDFETTENLEDVLLYFPKVNKYLEPTSIEYRFPFFNFNYGENLGLFIQEKEFGGVKMGIGTVKKIDIVNGEVTHDYMNITIDFSEDIENPSIHTNISFGGYSALNLQSIKDFTTDEQYREILKEIAKNYTLETEYKTLEIKNDGLESIGKNPFILDITFEGKDYTQKAGNNILFKVGETIGKQIELYQEDQRQLPVEIHYPHNYTRTIKIILPKGYVAKNLDSFNMDYQTVINGKTEAAFISSYKEKSNEIVITNSEYYSVIHYPLEVFESYRQVINAAADFNKITLVISKE